MKNKKFKLYKIKKLKKIKQIYNNIYIFRYNDLTINEIILIKKKLKKLNYNSIIIKKNLINDIFLNIKGQGSILCIYGNENNFEIQEFLNDKKLNLIYFLKKNNLYSFLKLKKIFSYSNIYLNYIITQPFIVFLYHLKKIKKANIT